MTDQIKQIIEQISSQEASQAKGITPDLANKVTEETGQSIISGLKDAVSQGNLSQLTDLFGDSSSLKSNPLVTGMISTLISRLTGKLGIDNGTAKGFADSVIPKVLGSLISKSKDENSGLQLTDLLTSFSGGEDTSGLLDKLTGSLSSDKKKDGNSGLDDPTSFIKGLF